MSASFTALYNQGIYSRILCFFCLLYGTDNMQDLSA